jgi:hypothetical protein
MEPKKNSVPTIQNFLILFTADSKLAQAISEGAEAIMKLVEAGEVPELQEVLRRQREGGNDSDDENLELRPEEHESYDGGDDDQRYYDEVCTYSILSVLFLKYFPVINSYFMTAHTRSISSHLVQPHLQHLLSYTSEILLYSLSLNITSFYYFQL